MLSHTPSSQVREGAGHQSDEEGGGASSQMREGVGHPVR